MDTTGLVLRAHPLTTARDMGEEQTTAPLMPPATPLDPEHTAAPASLDSMELEPPALRSTTVPMGIVRVRRVECQLAPTPALEPTPVPATLGTAGTGRLARP